MVGTEIQVRTERSIFVWRYEELFSQLKRALELTEQQECESAKELLEQVREQLDDDEEYKDLLGEWNLLMARMNFFDPDQAISYLQKARDMIDGR